MLKMVDLDLAGKRVIIREDLNVPIEKGQVQNDARLRAILPTLDLALGKQARIILLSHLGRPKEGIYGTTLSLKPVAVRLQELMQHPVRFEKNWLQGVACEVGEIVLCENVRFNVGEEANDIKLAKQMADLCDVFIMDAFGTAHRAQASTVGIAEMAKIAAAGPLLIAELEALRQALKDPKRPLVAIVGGAKVSSKLQILTSLLGKVDALILGGGIANTFIAATGVKVGKSLFEPDLIDKTKKIIQMVARKNVQLLIPQDVVVAQELSDTSKTAIRNIHDIKQDERIGDVGAETLKAYANIISMAGTVLWNGPLGVFELTPFKNGTETLANVIAHSSIFSIAGGGETLAAIDKFKVASHISYISTGGGAFLEYIEGKTLPAVQVLERKAELK